jgi:raffinose/stachyose/melibiose transport system substrate-binding protein
MPTVKLWTMGVATAIAVVTLGVAPASAQVKLDFWTEFAGSDANTFMNEIAADFNAANPDIQVVHTGFENTPYETALKTAFSGGAAPDIIEVNGGGDMFQYAEADQLVDLTEYVSANYKDLIRPGLETFYSLGGKSYAIPLELNFGNLFYYNIDMFAAQGLDPAEIKTWDDLLAAAQTFKDAGITPIAFGNQEGWPGNHIHNHLLLRILGPDNYVKIWLRTLDPSVTSDVSFAGPEEKRSWDMYKELLDKGYFTAGYLADDYPTGNSLFLRGEAPIFTMGSWFIADLETRAPDLNYDFAPYPIIEGTPGKQTDLVTAGLVLAIPKTTTHVAEAKRFLDYLASEPVQKKWSEGNVKMSPYKYDSSNWSYGPAFKKLAQMVADSTSAVPFGDMLEDYACNVEWTWQASQGILTGDITAEEIGAGHEDCVTDLVAKKFGN